MNVDKEKSKLGHFLTEHGISLEWLQERTGIHDDTFSELISDVSRPRIYTMIQVVGSLRRAGYDVRIEHFW